MSTRKSGIALAAFAYPWLRAFSSLVSAQVLITRNVAESSGALPGLTTRRTAAIFDTLTSDVYTAAGTALSGAAPHSTLSGRASRLGVDMRW